MKSGKSLSTKIILMVGAILLFSSAVFCAVSISVARVGIRKAIQQRMVDIANCAAGSVNGDILGSLHAGDEDTPEYKTIFDSMAVFRDNVELEYIYAIRDEGNGRFTFTVDTDLEAPGAFGDEVKYTEALDQASKGITSVDEVPYSDQWGEFYSAYSPVFDSEGRVAGIVAADFSVEWFDAQLQEQTFSNVRSYIVILLGTILAAAVLCLGTVRPYVRQQEQLLEEKVTAESANQAKSEFLANMSHEIRTPINAVLGMNEMILRESVQGSDLPADRTEEKQKAFEQIHFYAHEVERAGGSLLSIVNDVLDFSKIETGRMELVNVQYQLSAVLNDVSSMILYKAQEKGLEFTLDADPSLPDCLFGDEARVREILMNVLNNAVKYTERGFVRFTIRAGNQAGSTIRLLFTVEDSGIGIRQEDMDKLFNKFERLDLEHNSTVEGSGLGLPIARSFLDMMDGTIHVESEYGKGSVFIVMIPQRIVKNDPVGDLRVRQETSVAENRGHREIFHAPEARVLVVDDTKMNLTVTASLLKRTEMQIDTAGGGAEAVAMTEKKEYDIILMDQRMPEMDGTEALRCIRKGKDNPNSSIPVICLTADAIIGAKERYLSEGFTDYLTKPVKGEKLEAMLMKYLPAEKIIAVSGTEKAETGSEPPACSGDGDIRTLLRDAGIDMNTGLNYCQGDEELYRTLLAEYAADYPQKAEDIRRSRETLDWNHYSILVHSLKSSSAMLGAAELSGMAARMEAAANSGDSDAVRQDHEPMMTLYETIVRTIRNCVRIRDTEEEADILEFLPAETSADADSQPDDSAD